MQPHPIAPADPPPLRQSLLRIGLRIVVVAVVAAALLAALDWALGAAEGIAEEITTGMMLGAIAVFLLVYTLLIAVPFIPGIEIGVALLLMRGEAVAPYVYLATVFGLCLAFTIGHLVSDRSLHRLFSDLRLIRVCQLIEKLAPLSRRERMKSLSQRMPASLQRFVMPGRYIVLALLLNLPGNGFIGGGGGISMLAGLTRLFNPVWTMLTIAFAVLPVPLAVWIWGDGMLGAIWSG